MIDCPTCGGDGCVLHSGRLPEDNLVRCETCNASGQAPAPERPRHAHVLNDEIGYSVRRAALLERKRIHNAAIMAVLGFNPDEVAA